MGGVDIQRKMIAVRLYVRGGMGGVDVHREMIAVRLYVCGGTAQER